MKATIHIEITLNEGFDDDTSEEVADTFMSACGMFGDIDYVDVELEETYHA